MLPPSIISTFPNVSTIPYSNSCTHIRNLPSCPPVQLIIRRHGSFLLLDSTFPETIFQVAQLSGISLFKLPCHQQSNHELHGFLCQPVVPSPTYKILQLTLIHSTVFNTRNLVPCLAINLNWGWWVHSMPVTGINSHPIQSGTGWTRLISTNADNSNS